MAFLPSEIVFVDVDTQVDFMLPHGKLYVPGAEKIIPNLERLMRFAQEHGVAVISSVDAHAPDDPEFQQFPPHCVQGTPGQEKIPETLLPRRTVLPNQKEVLAEGEAGSAEFAHFKLCGRSRAQQWILEKQKFDLFTNAAAAALFEKFAAERFIVFGVATDYCVKAAVAGLLKLGKPVAVVTDAVQGIDPAASNSVLRQMQEAGAELLSTQEVLHAKAA